MRAVFRHIRSYVIRGVIASIPFVLTFLVVRFLYVTIDARIIVLVKRIIGDETLSLRILFPGLGILLLLAVLYIFGIIASNVVGRQFFVMIERLTRYIPFIRTTYQVGKQLSATLSLPDKELLKRPVLVEYLKPGIWTTGFVTGSIIDKNNRDEKLLKVFVPTPPNPTSGVMVIVKESQTRDPGWTIEEAFRMVISAGIIGPEEIDSRELRA